MKIQKIRPNNEDYKQHDNQSLFTLRNNIK